jgi:hypothetical protein
MKSTPTLGKSCKIVVVNDILDTRTEEVSPQSPEEAMGNHGQVSLAAEFLKWFGSTYDERKLDGSYPEDPIAVAILRTDDTIIVRGHSTGDDEAARARMREILTPGWWIGEEL